MNKGGRPSKFTPERRAAILASIDNHIPYELAAQANGICESTLYDWLSTGFKDLEAGIESEYAKFSEDLKKIEERRMLSHLKRVDESHQWQAQAWILERRWSKYYSQNAAILEINKRLDRIESSDKKDLQSNDETYYEAP